MASALSALFVSACAGDGPDPVPGASTTTTSVAGGSLLVPLQQTVFTPTCALPGCHDAVTQIQNLDLSSTAASYADLVGVASPCAGLVRVVPNDVDASYLVDKVGDGGLFCGLQMPQGLPPLNAQQLQLIRDWIDQGAPPADGLRFDVSTTKTTRTTRTTHTTNASSTTSTTAAPAG